MRALVELGKRASSDPAVELRLENLDDIDFGHDGSPTELLQTKHHLGPPGSITALSVDVWRTINVWLDLPVEQCPILRMVTTQVAAGDLALLRESAQRDAEKALVNLAQAARESDNKTSEPWREKFLGLSEEQQFALIDRIVVDDATPPASSLDAELTLVFRFAMTPGKDDVFLALIKGWWAGIAVQLLDRNLSAVTGNDLLTQVADIVDQLRSDSLPIDPGIMQRFDSSLTDNYRDREFVHQLMWIALENERLWKAIRDYHRAYAQRSFWLRYQLIGETELDRFAFKLHDEWEQVFDHEVAKMKRSGSTDHELVGQEILAKMAMESKARLRGRFDEPWFNRGMLQALADGEIGSRIGWHPEFQAKLEGLLNSASV
jgi:hypothetical protein